MSWKTAQTPEGFVVRHITPGGETAWRWGPDDLVSVCHGPKGPWVATSKATMPREAFRRLCALVIKENYSG